MNSLFDQRWALLERWVILAPIIRIIVGIPATAPLLADQGDLLVPSWRDAAMNAESVFARLRTALDLEHAVMWWCVPWPVMDINRKQRVSRQVLMPSDKPRRRCLQHLLASAQHPSIRQRGCDYSTRPKSCRLTCRMVCPMSWWRGRRLEISDVGSRAAHR